jgi:hypothetical protein
MPREISRRFWRTAGANLSEISVLLDSLEAAADAYPRGAEDGLSSAYPKRQS